jgi:hypothetical protein
LLAIVDDSSLPCRELWGVARILSISERIDTGKEAPDGLAGFDLAIRLTARRNRSDMRLTLEVNPISGFASWAMTTEFAVGQLPNN